MDKHLVISALQKASFNQYYQKGSLLHSDRDSQYTSTSYLKKEEVYPRHYSDYQDAKSSLFEYIEGFYNRNRIHSTLFFLNLSV